MVIVVPDDVITCGVCLELLDEENRTLDCGHTFCESCLNQIQSSFGRLQCPECRQCSHRGIQELKRNYLVTSIRNTMATTEPAPTAPSIDELLEEERIQELNSARDELENLRSRLELAEATSQSMELAQQAKEQEEKIRRLQGVEDEVEAMALALCSSTEEPQPDDGLVRIFEDSRLSYQRESELRKKMRQMQPYDEQEAIRVVSQLSLEDGCTPTPRTVLHQSSGNVLDARMANMLHQNNELPIAGASHTTRNQRDILCQSSFTSNTNHVGMQSIPSDNSSSTYTTELQEFEEAALQHVLELSAREAQEAEQKRRNMGNSELQKFLKLQQDGQQMQQQLFKELIGKVEGLQKSIVTEKLNVVPSSSYCDQRLSYDLTTSNHGKVSSRPFGGGHQYNIPANRLYPNIGSLVDIGHSIDADSNTIPSYSRSQSVDVTGFVGTNYKTFQTSAAFQEFESIIGADCSENEAPCMPTNDVKPVSHGHLTDIRAFESKLGTNLLKTRATQNSANDMQQVLYRHGSTNTQNVPFEHGLPYTQNNLGNYDVESSLGNSANYNIIPMQPTRKPVVSQPISLNLLDELTNHKTENMLNEYDQGSSYQKKHILMEHKKKMNDARSRMQEEYNAQYNKGKKMHNTNATDNMVTDKRELTQKKVSQNDSDKQNNKTGILIADLIGIDDDLIRFDD